MADDFRKTANNGVGGKVRFYRQEDYERLSGYLSGFPLYSKGDYKLSKRKPFLRNKYGKLIGHIQVVDEHGEHSIWSPDDYGLTWKQFEHRKIVSAARGVLHHYIGVYHLYRTHCPSGYEVDHCGEHEFKDILKKFQEKHGKLTYGDTYFDFDLGTRLIVKEKATEWLAFHDGMCRLQYLTIREHREKKRNEST